MKVGDIVIVPFGNKAFRAVGEVVGEYYFAQDGDPTYYHRRRVRWLKVLDEALPLDTIIEGDFMQRTFYSIAAGRVNWKALARLVRPVESEGQSPVTRGAAQQFVLIIDEINRANVSKVFGELITLIEPDKRLGMRNALKVRLPYSKREFGVPANLHIVGTMNTADRSIALLDTALRRRFRFEEMAPDTSIPAFIAAENSTGLPLGDVLNTMNRRIEYLVDRDHRIGHAFFIDCKTRADVDAVMRDKVIPLLQEYFFDDWNRLAAVLGEKDKGGNFLTCDIIEDPMGEGGEPLKSWRVRSHFDEGAYKRHEPYRDSKVAELAEAYDRDVWGEGIQGWCAMRDLLRTDPRRYKHLDAAQLVKHALGLATEGNRSGLLPVLVYLYAEPQDACRNPQEAFLVHRREIEDFHAIVGGNRVRFAACSWRGWLACFTGEAADHARAVHEAFAP